MTPSRPAQISTRRTVFRTGLLCSVFGLLFLTGCISRSGRGPASTHVELQPVRIPAQVIANFFFVESTQADGQTYRFMVDTGSSVTYVSAALADVLGELAKPTAAKLTVAA